MPLSHGLSGGVATSGAPLMLEHAALEPAYDAAVDAAPGLQTRTLLVVPVMRPGHAPRAAGGGAPRPPPGVGALLQAVNRLDADEEPYTTPADAAFTADDASLLGQVASLIAS